MIYVGIDPGLDGAVAMIDDNGAFVGVWDTPTLSVEKPASARARSLAKAKGEKAKPGHKRNYVESAMVRLFDLTKIAPHTTMSVRLENVHAMPGQGVTSMFSMGMGFGIWRGIIAALGIPVEYVEPSQWKRDMGLRTASDKNASIVLASRMFPAAPLTRAKDDGRAEALLIAEWSRKRSRS